MKKISLSVLPLLGLVLLLSTGCKQDYTGKEKTHPLFVKAGTAQASERYADAARLYEEFLLIAPKSAETHMKLASLYGDSLDEPLKAVYHYEKVILLRPEDDLNNNSIKEFITVAKKRLLEKLKEENRDIAAENAMKAELETTRKRLDNYILAYNQIKQKLYNARERILQADAIVKQYNRDKKKSSEAAAAVRKPAPAPGKKQEEIQGSKTPSNSSPAILGTHTVQSGDSLYKISRKYYGTGKYAGKIAEFNKMTLSSRIRVGQRLKLPRLDTKKQ